MCFEAQTITVRDQHQVAHPLPAMVGVQDDGTVRQASHKPGTPSRAFWTISMQK